MEKKYLTINTGLCVLLIGLISWALADIVLLGNPYTVLFTVLFGVLSFGFLVHLLISYLVIINKKYNIIIGYDKNSNYNYEIFNYNFHYCNNIIASCVIIGDALMLICFTALSSQALHEGIKIACIVAFSISTAAAIISVAYKYIQMQKYVKETNNIAKLIKEGKLD